MGSGHTHHHHGPTTHEPAHEQHPHHGGHHTDHHARGPGTEGSLGPSGAASVVLDIGPHAGALVLYTSEGLAGAEIEIRPGDGPWLGAHTAVRARHVGGRVRYAGVFGSLAPGAYALRLKGGGAGSFDLTLEVPAGRVTEAVIPSGVAAGDGPGGPSAQLSGVPLG